MKAQMMTRSTGVCGPRILSKINYERTNLMTGKIEQERRTTKIKDPRSFSPSNIGTWKLLRKSHDTGKTLLSGRKETKNVLTVMLKHGDNDD